MRGATFSSAPPCLVFSFQSTHPVRGATGYEPEAVPGEYISIHAPREGCDTMRLIDGDALRISIHAPREGCDRRQGISRTQSGDFNPRTP